MCHVSIFFLRVVSKTQRSKVFPFSPTWLPQHVTHDVIIIIKTFDTNRCSDKQLHRKTLTFCTDKQTDKLKGPSATPSPLARVTRTALGRAQTSTWLNSLRFVSH